LEVIPSRKNFYCRELSARSTGAERYNTTAKFLEEEMLQWKNCVSVCTDGAASMMGKSKGFVSKVKQINPDVQITAFCIVKH